MCTQEYQGTHLPLSNSFTLPLCHRSCSPSPGDQGSVTCSRDLERKMPSLLKSSVSFFFPEHEILSMMPRGVECPSGLLRSAVLTLSPAIFLFTLSSSLLGQSKAEKSLMLCKHSSARNKHPHVIKAVFSTNPRLNPILATKKKIKYPSWNHQSNLPSYKVQLTAVWPWQTMCHGESIRLKWIFLTIQREHPPTVWLGLKILAANILRNSMGTTFGGNYCPSLSLHKDFEFCTMTVVCPGKENTYSR